MEHRCSHGPSAERMPSGRCRACRQESLARYRSSAKGKLALIRQHEAKKALRARRVKVCIGCGAPAAAQYCSQICHAKTRASKTVRPVRPVKAQKQSPEEVKLRAVWRSMIARCHNERDRAYEYYGGRWIRVCDAWRGSFDAFIADMGMRPTPRHTLERVKNHLGYGPDNCIWATRKQQANNIRSNLRVDTDQGTATLAQLADRSGLNRYTIRGRLMRGATAEEAITTPVRKARPAVRITQERESAIVAFASEGLSHRAIASRIGCDSSVVSRTLKRVRERRAS